MSVGKNHVVNEFNSKTSEPLDESQRLAKIGVRNTEKARLAGKPERKPLCVSIPISLLSDEKILELKDIVQDLYEDMQDAIIRSILENDETVVSISDEQISFEAVQNYIVVASGGKGLKKDGVLNWWTNSVYAQFRAYVAPKLGIDTESLITETQALALEKMCNSYRDVFVSVAGKGALLASEHITTLEKILDSLELKDLTARKIASKLTAMKEEHKKMSDALSDFGKIFS